MNKFDVFVQVPLVLGDVITVDIIFHINDVVTPVCNRKFVLLLDVLCQGRLYVRTEVTQQTLIFLWMFLIKFWLTAASVPHNTIAFVLLVTNVTFDFFVLSLVISQTSLIITGFPTNVTNFQGLLMDFNPMFDKSNLTFELSSTLSTNWNWCHFTVIIIFFFDF